MNPSAAAVLSLRAAGTAPANVNRRAFAASAYRLEGTGPQALRNANKGRRAPNADRSVCTFARGDIFLALWSHFFFQQ